MSKRVVWTCNLGVYCSCDEVDQFCVNSRRREVDGEDDHEEASQEKAVFLRTMQTSQDGVRESVEGSGAGPTLPRRA